MKALERFTPQAAAYLRTAIAEAGCVEVFAAGKLDEAGLVSELVVAARGVDDAVPALAGFLDRGDVIVHNHPSGVLMASQADLAIAARAGEGGVGSYIVDNDVAEVYVVAEPVRAKALIALDEDQLAGVLDSGGKLAARLPGYEPRPSQLGLVRDAAAAFNNGLILAAEAGTGVGKSFAYLIPALAWAARNGERVVVSTATINLQRQLMDKDLPVASSIFKKKLKAVLVKGRGNYLCVNRLREALDEEGLFAGDDSPLRRIDAWSQNSPTGDRADLSFWPDDATWSRVCSEADECLGLRCPYRESCFVLKVRKDAADADILVANHHILFSDLAARRAGAGYEARAVLPPFNAIVFDEAHAIESSATSFFSEELARYSVYKQLGRLYRERRGRKFGIVTKLQNIRNLPPDVLKNFPAASDAVRDAMDELDRAALALIGDGQNYRLTPATRSRSEPLLEAAGVLERALRSLSDLLKTAIEEVPDESSEEPPVHEAKLSLRRLSELAGLCARYRGWEDDQESIFWLDRRRNAQGEAFSQLCVTPLDIGQMMDEAVFHPYRSVICTSATLSVGGSFAFWKRRVGLTQADERTVCREYSSPFPFKRNAILCAAQDAPDPTSPEWQEWINAALPELVAASSGRALVLFTSYTALRSAWDAVRPKLDALGLSSYRQGDDERSRLLDRFRDDVASVLFATDSFWEGVDLPGETLQHVIITKLPFRVPTDPVQMARSEAIERRGGNAFMDLSLPDAVIRFKQGFGRLIRHSEDRGAVTVLDSRLLKKRYGQIFIASLPETRKSFKNLRELCADVRSFLEE
ncbi:MAG: hypothetical protein JW923_05000 [Spirochaetales bacterium]|nr:hypothetical protein [Spirochaetales bacterium]